MTTPHIRRHPGGTAVHAARIIEVIQRHRLTNVQRAELLDISLATYYRYAHAYLKGELHADVYTCPSCLRKHPETYPVCSGCRASIARTHIKIRAHELRVKRRTIKHDFTPIQWLAKVADTCGVCPGCDRYVGLNSLTLDHIKPVSRAHDGDTYTINDVQPLCLSCNTRKGNRT